MKRDEHQWQIFVKVRTNEKNRELRPSLMEDQDRGKEKEGEEAQPCQITKRSREIKR
ncbi:hypothetical protein SESBI_10643 [Sesbania bispinosa]|nr:hypothetical protein SESBI_10643 [Sesbania bispinosa]